MSKKTIYLDHNATTPIHPEVKKTMIQAMEMYGNPSSLHKPGREAHHAVDQARKTVADFLGATPEEIVFVGSGSEANNTVLSTLIGCSAAKECIHEMCGKNEVVTTAIEHPCVLETSKCLKDRGINVHFLKVDPYGKINLSELEEKITKKTGIVSVMMANNEIGTIQDIKAISKITRKHGVLFHTDAVQAVGKLPVNVKELGVDFLTLSAHKMYGPKGIGALYIRKGAPYCPFIRGGHQEKGRRAGTENTLGIVALGKAIEMREKEMKDEEGRLLKFKKKLQDEIPKRIPDVSFNGHPKDSLAGTVNVSFPGAEGEAILLYLDLEGICVSTGSACASGSLDPSHVLLATGLSAEKAHGSIRISMGRETTEKEINSILEILPCVIKKIRDMSTVKAGSKS